MSQFNGRDGNGYQPLPLSDVQEREAGLHQASRGLPELVPLGQTETAPLLGGIRVIRSVVLPPNTMMVSSDVYEMLTDTPEQRQAKARALRDKADQLLALTDALLKRGQD